MYKFLLLISAEAFILTPLILTYSFSYDLIHKNKIKLSLLSLLVGSISGFLYIIVSEYILTSTGCTFCFLLTICACISVLFLFIEKGWQHPPEDITILDFQKNVYCSNFSESDTTIFSYRKFFAESSHVRVNFGFLRPPANVSFKAYCIQESNNFCSDKDYKCISFSYEHSTLSKIEDLLVFISSILTVASIIFNLTGPLSNAFILYVISYILKKLTQKNHYKTCSLLLLIIFNILEFFSIGLIFYSIFLIFAP